MSEEWKDKEGKVLTRARDEVQWLKRKITLEDIQVTADI